MTLADQARIFAAVLVGVAALGVGGFGAWGLTVVARDWSMCAGDTFPAALGGSASYPLDFCQRVDWTTQWGIGIALVSGSVAAIVFAIWLARWRRRPDASHGA